MKKNYRVYWLIGLLILSTGCIAAPINRYNAALYHDQGLLAEKNDDFLAAKKCYDRALMYMRMGSAPKAGISMGAYNLGRVAGYLCDFDIAEQLLLESLRLQEAVPSSDDPDHAILSMRFFEIARFYYDLGRYKEAIPYLERGIPIAESLDVESIDPIAYANVLDEYVIALKQTNDFDRAQEIEAKAGKIRSSHAGQNPVLIPRRYNQNCKEALNEEK